MYHENLSTRWRCQICLECVCEFCWRLLSQQLLWMTIIYIFIFWNIFARNRLVYLFCKFTMYSIQIYTFTWILFSLRPRLEQCIVTIASLDQWLATIENHRHQWLTDQKTIEKPLKNHWSQWLSSYHSTNGNGHLRNHWFGAMVVNFLPLCMALISSFCLKIR